MRTKLQTEASQRRIEISSQKATIRTLNDEREELKAQNKELEDHVDEGARRIVELQNSIANLTRENDRLKAGWWARLRGVNAN